MGYLMDVPVIQLFRLSFNKKYHATTTVLKRFRSRPFLTKQGHIQKEKKIAGKYHLTDSIQNLKLINQAQANLMVLENFLPITDLDMKIIIEKELLIKIADHIIPQQRNEAKAKSACLIYGHPGAGKTRLFRELTAALNGAGSRDFYNRLSDVFLNSHIRITDVAVAVVTFNTPDYGCTEVDAHLCNVCNDLPVALRLFYAYFDHNYSRNSAGFNQMRADLLQLSRRNDKVLKDFTVKRLLDEILQGNSGKKHLLLLIDETLALQKQLKHDDRFINFLSYINKLQDAKSGNCLGDATCFSVIYSGLLDGPWKKDASTSNRQLKKYLLSPLAPTSDAFHMILNTQGIKELSYHYKLMRGTTTNQALVRDALAQYLFFCCAGLPRALEVMRHELRNLQSNYLLRDILNDTARLLNNKYELVTDGETLYLALLGRPVDGTIDENKEYVAKLHTYMSEGKCMLLIARDPYGGIAEGCVRVSIPPLRLLGAKYSGRRDLAQFVALTSEMNEKTFENFLVRHEVIMRRARRHIVSKKLNNLFMDPYRDIDLSSATLQELYFGFGDGNDIEVEWRDETVRKAKFDFIAPLEIKFMRALPHFSQSGALANYIIVSSDVNQKGFEYAIILRTKEVVPRMIALLVQAKFTKIKAVQEAGEVINTAKKCAEVSSKFGWPEENVVVLFQTNRKRREYQTSVEKQNLILMCRESLESYMGPTVWDMLQSCHCLSNLQLSVSESVEEEE